MSTEHSSSLSPPTRQGNYSLSGHLEHRALRSGGDLLLSHDLLEDFTALHKVLFSIIIITIVTWQIPSSCSTVLLPQAQGGITKYCDLERYLPPQKLQILCLTILASPCTPFFSCHNVPFSSAIVKYLGQFLALSEKTLPPTSSEKLHVYIFSNKNWSNV